MQRVCCEKRTWLLSYLYLIKLFLKRKLTLYKYIRNLSVSKINADSYFIEKKSKLVAIAAESIIKKKLSSYLSRIISEMEFEASLVNLN